jgi:uncharacterized repeat protein (TIGR03803 family)
MRCPLAFAAISLSALLVVSEADAASRYKVLHSFGNGKDGAGVWAGLALGSKGDLYGATSGGGAYQNGTVFELEPGPGGKWAETILHSFCAKSHCPDGWGPVSTPTLDAAGNLYGNDQTTTFEMTPGSGAWGFEVIYSAGARDDSLVLDAAGNVYSDYLSLGINYHGAISELTPGPDGWKEKDLYDFCPVGLKCLDGEAPEYGLTWDAAGNLYGVTTYGGTRGHGVAFELEHAAEGWKEHVLYDYYWYPPSSSLVFDNSGNLYGTTFFSEGYGCGTVYQLSAQTNGHWRRTNIYTFPHLVPDGGCPMAPVVYDPRLNVIYGTATAGGDPVCQCGVIFKLSPQAGGKWKYTVLYKFHGPDGNGPNGLTIDSKGRLYGTTVAGGAYGYGTTFELTP